MLILSHPSHSPPYSNTILINNNNQLHMNEPLRLLILSTVEQITHAFPSQDLNDLKTKLSEEKKLVEVISLIFKFLIEKATQTKTARTDNSKADYEALQEMVQKAEQEIRKHIRIQQQMKLYSDSLEERVEALQLKINRQRDYIEQIKADKEDLRSKLRTLQQQVILANRSKSRSRIHTESVIQNTSLSNLKRTVNLSLQQRQRRVKQEGLNQKASYQMLTRVPDTLKHEKASMQRSIYKEEKKNKDRFQGDKRSVIPQRKITNKNKNRSRCTRPLIVMKHSRGDSTGLLLRSDRLSHQVSEDI